MLSALQHALSARPTRTVLSPAEGGDAQAGPYASADGLVTLEFAEEDGEDVLYGRFKNTELGKTAPTTSPLHIDWNYSHTLKVISGTIIFLESGNEHELTPSSDPFRSTPCAPGHWWLKPGSGDAAVRVTGLHADSLGRDFMLNVQGYVNDCYMAKLEPSPFQLVLFLYTHSQVLAIPGLPLALNKALHRVLGWGVGHYLLGYEPSYGEYSGKQTKKQS